MLNTEPVASATGQAQPITATAQVTERRVEFDYLRSFVIVLVLWHHAILAYAAFSSLNPENPIETFSPVVDSRRWLGFDLMAGFNDTFFMALMFFISGLFVWRSLARKGSRHYLSGRLIRLGIPFVIAVPLLIPLAYYPAQLTVEAIYGGDTGYGEFWLTMVRAGFGTAGPLWFLWLLLLFDALATILYRFGARSSSQTAERTNSVLERPVALFSTILGLSTIAYLPMVFTFGPSAWVGAGPFDVQISRLFFYLVYFLAGTAVGAYGLERSLLKRDGALARRWWAWLLAGLISFAVLLVLVIGGQSRPVIDTVAFTLTCATLVFAALAFFLRFATRRIGVFDSLAVNAYGIYIFHYAFVTWLQYGLLGTDLSAPVKAILVFAGALLLSWGTVTALRRIPIVARVI